MTMLHSAEIDMATSVAPSDIATFLTNAACAIRSTYHTILKASPGAAIFGRDMLFDIPYIADWNILVRKDGILRKTESRYNSEPWTITSVHMNGTIRVERRSK
jgi:hypothetical protein